MIPSRDIELELLSLMPSGSILAGVDEVGRGSLAGPVSVGIALIDSNAGDFPSGLKDSKQISALARENLVPGIHEWVLDVAVGHADADTVDRLGIMAALRVAAANALEKLDCAPHAILLDGSHNWWSDSSLFEEVTLPALPVHMQVKGDASCAIVAAASVAAKVERDNLMIELDNAYPGYDWARNKGYSSPAHIEALKSLGASPMHRTSWNLPGITKGLT